MSDDCLTGRAVEETGWVKEEEEEEEVVVVGVEVEVETWRGPSRRCRWRCSHLRMKMDLGARWFPTCWWAAAPRRPRPRLTRTSSWARARPREGEGRRGQAAGLAPWCRGKTGKGGLRRCLDLFLAVAAEEASEASETALLQDAVAAAPSPPPKPVVGGVRFW
jgi:hypothetical protein